MPITRQLPAGILAMKPLRPDLSVIIPLHDQCASIGCALDSLAMQTGLEPEIVVVDDASTDASVKTVEDWQRLHSEISLNLLRLPERKHALAARIAGINAAKAPDILLMDADDRLLGTDRLASVLAAKRESGAELAHFQSQLLDGEGNFLGEVSFDAPLAIGLLTEKEKMERYLASAWPPGELWGKIYSRSLLERVVPFIEGKPIYRLDTIISLLALFAARSYLGCEEIVYEYKMSGNWPLAKFAQRLHDIPINYQSLLELCGKLSIPEKYPQAYLLNFLLGFIAWNGGKLSIEAEERLANGQSHSELLGEIEKDIDLEILLGQILYSTQRNALKIQKVINRILHEF